MSDPRQIEVIATVSVKPERISYLRKLLYSSICVALFLIGTELLLGVLGFQTATVRRDPFAGFSKTSRLFVLDSASEPEVYRTSTAKLPFFNPQSFPRSKRSNTRRVFCLGGSTTFGRPFDDRTSYANWIRESLSALDPSMDWEVINAGGISYASYRLLNVMEELVRYEPDLFIVYTGHNEFLEDRTYQDVSFRALASSGWLEPLYRTRILGCLDFVVQSLLNQDTGPTLKNSDSINGGLKSEVDAILDHSVGPDAYTLENLQADEVQSHFQYNLQQMIRVSESVNAQIIFIKPASNVKDFSPFKSESLVDVSAAERGKWTEVFLEADKLYRSGDLDLAFGKILEAEAIDSTRADFLYLKGQILFARGDLNAAEECFKNALENDVCPLRARTGLVELVSAVALKNNVPLVDFDSILREDCLLNFGHRSFGKEYFLDHVHPTVATHRLIAAACLDAIKQIGWLKYSEVQKQQALDLAAANVDSSVDAPLQAKALSNLAQVLSWAGKQSEAAPLAAKALEIQDALGLSDPEAMFYAAADYAVNGEDEKSIALLRQLLDLDSNHDEARWRLASLLYDQGSYGEAVEHYRIVCESGQADKETRRMFGYALLRNGDHRGATDVFRQYLGEVPEDEGVANELRRLLGGYQDLAE